METKKTTSNLLRQKAEELLKNEAASGSDQSLAVDILALIHELSVHQIELEMQNNELQLAKLAETANRKFTELYDFAPTGYFTLTNQGTINEINLHAAAILGKERSYLKGKRLGLYFNNHALPAFNNFLDQIYLNKRTETCEASITSGNGAPVYVHLTGVVHEYNEQCLITMVDISAIKKVQESETFLNEAQQIANLGAYSMDLATGQWKSSENLDRIFGIDAQFDRSVEGWASLVHPEWQQIMVDYFANDVIGNKNDFDKEYKIVRNTDKAERWVHGIGQVKIRP